MFNKTSTVCIMLAVAIVLICYFGVKASKKEQTNETAESEKESADASAKKN